MVSPNSTHSRIGLLLGTVKDIDVSEQIVRTRTLGEELDFSDCKGMFEEFQELASALSEVAWEILPPATQTAVLSSIQNLQTTYFAITEFAAAEGQDRRSQLAIEFEQRFDEFKEKSLPYAGYLLWKDSSVQRRTKALLEGSEETLASARAKDEELERIRAEFTTVLDAARGAVAGNEASNQASTFELAANRYESLAKRWLWGSIGTALATIGVGLAVVFVWNAVGDDGTAALAQAVLGRAAVLAVLSYATVTAIRMYRSNSHLAVVNRHREDALRSFNAFRAGAHSDDTKDEILRAATYAAFGQTATGLIGEKAEGGSPSGMFEGFFARTRGGS